MKCPVCNTQIKQMQISCNPFSVGFSVEAVGGKLEIISGLNITEKFLINDINNKDKELFEAICPKCANTFDLTEITFGIECYKCGKLLDSKDDFYCAKASRTYCVEHATSYLEKSCATCPIKNICSLGKKILKG